MSTTIPFCTVKNLFKTTQSYTQYVDKPIAFRFYADFNILQINNNPVAEINNTIPTYTNGAIKLDKLGTYTNISIYDIDYWTIPSNNLGQFKLTPTGPTWYVVFGYIDENGYVETTAGTCGADILLQCDLLQQTNSLKGCSVDALSQMTSCGIITTQFQLLGQPLGEIPIL